MAQHVQGVTVVVAAALILAAPARAEDEQKFDPHQNVVDFWMSKGTSREVAEGIYRRVIKESAGNPEIKGDNGTSLGLYMHHNARMKTLLANVENDQAFQEVIGADPIASKHWAEIKAAKTRQEAEQKWTRYFERPAGTPMESTPRTTARPTAAVTSPRPASQPAGGCMASYMGVCLTNPQAVATLRRLASPAPPMPASRPYQPQPVYTAPSWRPVVPPTNAILALAAFLHHRK